MPVSSELEKQLKKAIKTGKFVVGRKEVQASLKGSKLLVWSVSANISTEMLDQCKSLQIPALRFDGDPIALGKLCGIPFKVSVVALKSAGDADIGLFSNSRDYAMGTSKSTVPQVETEVLHEREIEPEVLSKKTRSEEKEAPKKKLKNSKSKKPESRS